jgi:hypothetical protein
LISVVAFIRSRPAIPGVPAGVGPRNVSGSPITAVARKGDDLVIALRTSDATGERVTVSFATGQWAVTHFEWWIV